MTEAAANFHQELQEASDSIAMSLSGLEASVNEIVSSTSSNGASPWTSAVEAWLFILLLVPVVCALFLYACHDPTPPVDINGRRLRRESFQLVPLNNSGWERVKNAIFQRDSDDEESDEFDELDPVGRATMRYGAIMNNDVPSSIITVV
mmetsp:Transcript_5153/g.7835  ORF Transcript_5153/g.7835 Transcript_5153/m.7835 type:complete len:149 (+) Transcript_5153:90-536(+)|eukprot:CAMPEP_0195291730 /NCGR_PEP_ID=MMETSP0707-20130614/8155_1 /TAXON_ID=33640 /ORGANISM="Asterionellopsis glacialis, Strain CCMP134" /LENGTH=148 /DNA_ID=CAMNT_0040352075 /DNA_START=28 /DNA_END=474 /DNA_ORIENTATION=+